MTRDLALLATDINQRLEELVNDGGGYLDPARRKNREDLRRFWAEVSADHKAEGLSAYILAATEFLQKELSWHRRVLDQLPAPVSVYDLNLRWSYINKSAADMIGSGDNSFYLGKRYRDGWKYYETDDSALAEDDLSGLKRLMRPLNESGRFLVSQSSFLTDINEQPIGLIETLRLASAEEETIDILTDEEEARQVVLESTPLACLYFDQEGFLSDCNQQAASFLGLPDKRNLLRYFYRLLPWKMPDGRNAGRVLIDCILSAFDNGFASYDNMILRSAGGFDVPAKVRMVRINWRGAYAVLASLYPKAHILPLALVVDDIEVNQLMVSRFLKRMGLRVKVAANGRQALEMIKVEKFDLVLMDVEMPFMDGLTATREIRKIPGREDMPIISLTTLDTDEDRARCLDAGMDDHLPKPVSPTQLRMILDRWLQIRLAA